MIIALLLFWGILSGQTAIFFIVTAILSALLTISIDKNLFPNSLLLKLNKNSFIFTANLMKDMFLSSMLMIKIIWLKPKEVQSCYMLIDAKSKNAIDQVIQANTITLTPGTMSMNLENNQILVHAINLKAMDELKIEINQ